MTFWQNTLSAFGVIKVDINSVIAKAISGVELAAHEADALLNWVLGQTSTIQADLNAAAPIIAAVTGLVTTVASGNPAIGAAAEAGVNAVNTAFGEASRAVAALNAASAALNASKNAGNGAVVNDTAAIMAGVQSVTGATSTVANVKTAALTAAAAIQAAISAPPVAAAA